MTIPTGDEDAFVGAGAVGAGLTVVLDKKVSIVNIVGNLGVSYLGEDR